MPVINVIDIDVGVHIVRHIRKTGVLAQMDLIVWQFLQNAQPA